MDRLPVNAFALVSEQRQNTEKGSAVTGDKRRHCECSESNPEAAQKDWIASSLRSSQ
jgi:hypothetical protein